MKVPASNCLHQSGTRTILVGHIPNGSAWLPSQFSKIYGNSVRNFKIVLVYIDDILVHTATHEEHLVVLEKVFQRLHTNILKVNLEKCVFGNSDVSYRGFTFTPSGIKPGQNQLQAIWDAQQPATVKMVRSFIGLCNFFRTHKIYFAIIAATPFKLLEKILDTSLAHLQLMLHELLRFYKSN